MTHAEDAARLAKKIEKDNPAAAGVIHALLALAEQSGDGDWNKLDSFEDLPEQLEQDYIFEYTSGGQAKWRFSNDNKLGVDWFYVPGDMTLNIDPNDLVDQCTRWRYA